MHDVTNSLSTPKRQCKLQTSKPRLKEAKLAAYGTPDPQLSVADLVNTGGALVNKGGGVWERERRVWAPGAGDARHAVRTDAVVLREGRGLQVRGDDLCRQSVSVTKCEEKVRQSERSVTKGLLLLVRDSGVECWCMDWVFVAFDVVEQR